VWQPRPKFQDRVWLNAALLLSTVATTTFIGALYYAGYISAFERAAARLTETSLLIHGLWYSGTVLAILGSHEMGHYLACRYYDVDASLPFFLPMPLFPTGTLGAFIRIREPIPEKRMLFDIGIAGPIAGFLVALPALFIGLSMSTIVAIPNPLPSGTIVFGEPLLYKIASRLMWGAIPSGYDLNLHPMAFGAWFGLLATALNLFPISQLDGGHISYAVLGRKSSFVTLVGIAVGITLSYFASSWIVWTVLMILMIRVVGRHHPPVFDEERPLDRSRIWLAGFAVVISFMPVPLTWVR
jgi:membrane-associated protease RseP (regulator of RpoE activity)